MLQVLLPGVLQDRPIFSGPGRIIATKYMGFEFLLIAVSRGWMSLLQIAPGFWGTIGCCGWVLLTVEHTTVQNTCTLGKRMQCLFAPLSPIVFLQFTARDSHGVPPLEPMTKDTLTIVIL
jgi:hypothetical protein